MNGKRMICLALAALLALTPLVALAAGEKYVKNTGAEPVGVFAAIGDGTPVRTLAPGAQVRWLADRTADGALWYQVEGGFVEAGPGIEVTEGVGEASDPPAVAARTPGPESVRPTASARPEAEGKLPAHTAHGGRTESPVPHAPEGNAPGQDPAPASSDDPGEGQDPAPTDSVPDPTPSDNVPDPTPSDNVPDPTPTDSVPDPTPSASATPAATPAPTSTPRPGGAAAGELIIDTAYVYPGMSKSYADGYMPTVSKGKALFVLPLLGDVMGDEVRVTPEISTSGPFLYGNYQFDLKKSTETATDAAGREASRRVFLIRLSLDLAKNRYNGTYPVTFRVSYTDMDGRPAEQTFTLQVTITDGKKPSSGSSGGGPTAVKKPVLVLKKSEISSPAVVGGEAFLLTLEVENVGDLEAKNVRILVSPEDQGFYRSDSLAPLFLATLETGGSAGAAFPFASDRTVFAGRHGIRVELSYEDKYGNVYGDAVSLQFNVVQESSVGFDEMKLPETLTSGETFTQPVCVYNTGYAPVYNVRCTLRMDGLIAASAFLGTLGPQESADKAISVFVTTLSGKEKYGAAYGELVISYEDMFGTEHTDYQQLRTTIQAPVVVTDEEKAKQEKEQKEQQTLSQWWVSLLVAIAFILVVLSVIVITRFSRMLKMK